MSGGDLVPQASICNRHPQDDVHQQRLGIRGFPGLYRVRVSEKLGTSILSYRRGTPCSLMPTADCRHGNHPEN